MSERIELPGDAFFDLIGHQVPAPHSYYVLRNGDGKRLGVGGTWSGDEARSFATAMNATQAATPSAVPAKLVELSRKGAPGRWHGGHRCDGSIVVGPKEDRWLIGQHMADDDARLASEAVNHVRQQIALAAAPACPAPAEADEGGADMVFTDEPTARADDEAEYLREWYEAHRESWADRYGPNAARKGVVADNFMLALIKKVIEIRRASTRTACSAPAEAQGGGQTKWQTEKSAPEGVPVCIRSQRHNWYATAKLVRYCEDDEASRGPATSWDILHYNGDTSYRGFYGTGELEWAPLRNAITPPAAERPDGAAGVREASVACEMLAEEYEQHGYPSYAKLARESRGDFTLCSIRAIDRALKASSSPRPDATPSDVPAAPGGGEVDAALKLGLLQGRVMACTTIIRTFDQPSIAEEILAEAGVSEADLLGCGLDEYDIDVSLPLVRKLNPTPDTQEGASRDGGSQREGGL